jgi:hypothetical protein
MTTNSAAAAAANVETLAKRGTQASEPTLVLGAQSLLIAVAVSVQQLEDNNHISLKGGHGE